MKFSAVTILISQALPTWSETPVRAKLSKAGRLAPSSGTVANADIFRAAQERRLTAAQRRLAFHLKGLKNGPQILKSNLYCDPSSTDPDTGILSCSDDHVCQASLGSQFGGICVPKTDTNKQSSTGQALIGSLRKLPRYGRPIHRGAATDPVPCDPTSADVGILACGPNQVCKVDKTSTLGGFCALASAPSRRLDTVSLCDKNAPDFNSNCRCDGLNNSTGTGVVDCLLYKDYPLGTLNSTCEGINLTITYSYTFENSVMTEYGACYTLETPVYQKSCLSTNVDSQDGACNLTLNGQACSFCNINATNYDCTNVQGGGAGEYPAKVIPSLADCIYSSSDNTTYSSNCTLCPAGDYMAYANYGVNVTLPGGGEISCAYLAIAEYLSLIPEAACSALSAVAQTGCCEHQCKLCGSTAYIPTTKYDTQLNLVLPGYDSVTCGSLAQAAYVNFTIPTGNCDSIGGLIQDTCCEAIPQECSLCDGPLANPDANVTIEGYNVQCSFLQSFLSVLECASVSTLVSPTCCSTPTSAPVETPTDSPIATAPTPATPTEPGGASTNGPTGSGPETSGAAHIVTRGAFVSSVVGAMIGAVLLVASC